MPVVTVYGISKKTSTLLKNTHVRPGIKEAIAGVPELNISPKHVSVFFHQEDTENTGFANSQNDVVVFVDLFKRPERTPEALNNLCRAVVAKIQELGVAKGALVECFCRPLDSQAGFWSSEM